MIRLNDTQSFKSNENDDEKKQIQMEIESVFFSNSLSNRILPFCHISHCIFSQKKKCLLICHPNTLHGFCFSQCWILHFRPFQCADYDYYCFFKLYFDQRHITHTHAWPKKREIIWVWRKKKMVQMKRG